jgi:LuxR family maltose regulon positive regulatory protein
VWAAVFTVPSPPDATVRRARLEDRLDVGVHGPLTLVVAPAGTGKTILVSSWASGPRPNGTVVWLALDQDAVRRGTFWRLFATGLAGQGVVLPAALLPQLEGDEASFLAALAAIAEGVLAHPSPVILVLDCDAPLSADVAANVEGLLRRAGGWLRVVLLAREDPLLPLHRYRLADTMVELRMADLAFTAEEAGALLTGAGIELSVAALDATMSRTQGWAAGLRMAAMFLAHSPDREQAARRFAGDAGTVAEYLLAEVLNAQPDGMRRLLLDTSVVDVLRPGLASALAGPHAERALSFLVHGNAFLEEHPDPGCYRYHDLFRELLRAQLAYESPARAVELHRVAAQWFAENGLVVDAVRHAVLSRDWETAARYAVDDLSVPTLLTTPQTEALHEALAKIPASADGTAVSVVGAARAVAAGDWKGAAARLRRARELLDESAGQSWPASELAVAVLDLLWAGHTGDADAVLESAATAQGVLRVQDSGRLAAHPEINALVQTCRGMGLVVAGRPEDAADAFAAATAHQAFTGQECVVSHALVRGALLAAMRGQLTLSAELATRALPPSSVTEPGDDAGAAEAALAYVLTERYDLRGGRRHAERASRSEPTPMDPLPAVLLALARARISRAGDDLDTASAILDEARTVAALPGWLADVIGREEVAVLAAQGKSGRAADLARQLDDVSAPQGGLARDDAAPAHSPRSVAPGSWAPAQRVRRPASVDELVQSATLHAQNGHEAPALEDLEHALRLAAPEHSRRAFREAPTELWHLLHDHDELFVQHAWLTDGAPDRPDDGRRWRRPQVRSVLPPPNPSIIYEPLTEREREVLVHLSELLSTQEIAATMFVSINTVRTHVRNILRKLAASRRNEAVRRARQLGVISDDR